MRFAHLTAGLALATVSALAAAVPTQHTWDFTATFASSGLAPVSGSITATLDLDNFTRGDIDAIDLTLGGHRYAASEVVYLNNAGWLFFGGKFADETVIVSGHDDFYVYWMNPANPQSTANAFAYTSASDPRVLTADLVTGTERAASVPEPGSVALLGTGLALAALALRRRAA